MGSSTSTEEQTAPPPRPEPRQTGDETNRSTLHWSDWTWPENLPPPRQPSQTGDQRNRSTSHSYASEDNHSNNPFLDTYTQTPKKPKEPEIIEPPKKIDSIEEFPNVWFDWNASFRLYVNRLNIPYDKQGILLLNLIGPVGQQLYRTFEFDHDHNQSHDISKLAEKFDMYAFFGSKTKRPDTNIAEYIEELRKALAAKNFSCDEETLIARKLLQEVDVERFKSVTEFMMPSFQTDLSTLNLQQIVRIWNKYETPTDLMEENSYCYKCGMTHGKYKCTAIGKQCYKCKQWNHLASTCKVSFINDCHFCATSHPAKCCPAWGKTCDVCKKENHFPIRCKTMNTLLCRFCNTWHIPNRYVCPAKQNICGKCKRMGHYQVLCPEQPR